MVSRHRRVLTGLIAAVLMLAIPLAAHGEYYPNDGDFTYDGYYFGESNFLWSSPGPWENPDPGYEHDLVLNPQFLYSCTSWTNMPYGYDDCPTAGVSDPPDQWVFSFGTFHANHLQANQWYRGSWNLSPQPGGPFIFGSNYKLQGQENRHAACSEDSIWCMGAVRTYDLIAGTLYWAQSHFREW